MLQRLYSEDVQVQQFGVYFGVCDIIINSDCSLAVGLLVVMI